MTREQTRAIGPVWSLAVRWPCSTRTGSHGLRHIDAALVGYTFACLFAAFAVAYRYSMWLQRPPMRQYWRRGWQAFVRPGRAVGAREDVRDSLHRRLPVEPFHLAAQPFPRSDARADYVGLPCGRDQRFLSSLGGFISRPCRRFVAVPSVRARPARRYVSPRLVLGEMIFHGLVWSAPLVIPGVLLAFRRRFRDHGPPRSSRTFAKT